MASYQIKFGSEEIDINFDYPSKNTSDITDKLDKLKKTNLTIEDLYQITLWKVDRCIRIKEETIKKLNLLASINNIDEKAKIDTKAVLRELLPGNTMHNTGVRISMASTYLRFLNPKVFQIMDRHAYRAAFDYVASPRDYSSLAHEKQIDTYFKYLTKLHEIEKTGYHGYKVAFENLDRFLYDFDKFNGYKLSDNPQPTEKEIEKKLKEFIEKQKEQNKGGK